MNPILHVRNLTVQGATRTVLDDVSFDLAAGRVVAMLGPNGAGKSELVMALAGILPFTGEVALGERLLATGDARAVRAAGIAAVPEGHRLLQGLSVLDNLRAAGSMHSRDELNEGIEDALTSFPELRALSGRRAGSMSGGQQQMLAIAQALIARPRFLLLDEMSLGLAPIVVERLVEVVGELRVRGMGILLIEQFTRLALGLADECHVLARGRLQYSGPPDTLLAQPEVLEKAYLGA